jgi:transcriptional regulator with XRE-family HTH domain
METSFPHRQGLAERIAEARSDAGLTNSEVAYALGVTRKTVERWQTTGESGAGSIKADSIFALAGVLDVDPTWLLVGDHAEVAS